MVRSSTALRSMFDFGDKLALSILGLEDLLNGEIEHKRGGFIYDLGIRLELSFALSRTSAAL